MSMNQPLEKKAEGRAEFQKALERNVTRRDFMKGLLATGAVVPLSAAAYFGYQLLKGNPIKVGLIGAGDEGGVLVGAHNPDCLQFVAVADIRPSNMDRIFKGEPSPSPRLGFDRIYGVEPAKKDIQRYTDYKELLARKDIDAVVVALPLHLHAPVAMEAMRHGKHVLCEKLMARNITQCKEMIKVAEETKRILTIGHQRHYSLLYAYAVELLQAGELGDIKHIRALWHRNNSRPLLDEGGTQKVDERGLKMFNDGWRPAIKDEDRDALAAKISQFDYDSMEQLVRWRLFNKTGAGLMAELGSHQLDACGIFLGKVHPLAVQGVGTKSFYRQQYNASPPAREVYDHVHITFEYPGATYYQRDDNGQVVRDKGGKPVPKDKDDIIVVTYSSVSTNNFEPYGECVMGTQGTLMVEKEEEIMLYPDLGKKQTGISSSAAGGGKPAQASAGSPGSGPAASAAGRPAVVSGASGTSSGSTVSKGYREEMEHFAYCIRMLQEAEKAKDEKEIKHWRVEVPRCHGKVAMADAIIALTSNLAMEKKERIVFQEDWFDPENMKAVPEAKSPPTV